MSYGYWDSYGILQARSINTDQYPDMLAERDGNDDNGVLITATYGVFGELPKAVIQYLLMHVKEELWIFKQTPTSKVRAGRDNQYALLCFLEEQPNMPTVYENYDIQFNRENYSIKENLLKKITFATPQDVSFALWFKYRFSPFLWFYYFYNTLGLLLPYKTKFYADENATKIFDFKLFKVSFIQKTDGPSIYFCVRHYFKLENSLLDRIYCFVARIVFFGRPPLKTCLEQRYKKYPDHPILEKIRETGLNI